MEVELYRKPSETGTFIGAIPRATPSLQTMWLQTNKQADIRDGEI